MLNHLLLLNYHLIRQYFFFRYVHFNAEAVKSVVGFASFYFHILLLLFAMQFLFLTYSFPKESYDNCIFYKHIILCSLEGRIRDQGYISILEFY